jgi:hypothetical protein
MGRPKVKIGWREFDALCVVQATAEEIAAFFGCSTDTISRAVQEKHGCTFAEYLGQKRGKGKISLRRAQMQAALAGDKTMLIFLGKQYLGQADRIEQVDPDRARAAVAAEMAAFRRARQERDNNGGT